MADFRLASIWERWRRYAGISAAFLLSGANFVLALYLQKSAGMASFGLFALVQVYIQFGMSLSNGLFCSPIILAIQPETGRRRQQVIASFARASLSASLGGAAALYLTVLALSGDATAALLAAIYGIGSWTRWFFRSVELADGHVLRPASADILYSAIVCLGVASMMLLDLNTLHAAFAVQTAGCVGAFAAMAGSAFAAFRDAFRAPAAPFNDSFRKHGRWAVLGVATTEATANAHPYIIGAVLGPAAFAPIAAVTLFYRPLTIVAQALTQYERPRMAKAIQQGAHHDAISQVRTFQIISISCWAANSAAVILLTLWTPHVLYNQSIESHHYIELAIAICIIYFIRSARDARGAAIQASGEFSKLSMTSILSSIPSVLITLAVVCIHQSGPLSIFLFGVIAGELVQTLLVRRLYKRKFEITQATS